MQTPEPHPQPSAGHNPSLPRFPIQNVPSGLISFCQRNARRAYVIPSGQNFITCPKTTLSVQMKHVKLDIGATRSLWYFPSTESLQTFFNQAPSIEDVMPKQSTKFNSTFVKKTCNLFLQMRVPSAFQTLWRRHYKLTLQIWAREIFHAELIVFLAMIYLVRLPWLSSMTLFYYVI